MLHRICVLFIVAGLAVACDEAPVEPADDRALDATQFDYANGPEQVAHLYRYEDHLAWIALDFERNLFAIFSTFPVCGSPGQDLQPVSWQDNELPAAMNDAIQQVGKADEVYVYVADWVGPTNCATLTNHLLASGFGQLRLHDNDIYAWAEDHMRSNAWGATGQGKLTLAGSGARARVNYVGNHVWDPNGEQNLHTDKINLTPDPR
jgi:hypothetical protein